MASAAFYAQINFYASSALDTVPAGQIAIGAKSDGLYAKFNSLESRLLVVADIGVNVAAYSHTHNYDNYQYWYCKVGLTTDNILSKSTVEYYAGTGISLALSNPSQNLSRVSISISDDVVRKSGTPVQYCIPIFNDSNTVIASLSLAYAYESQTLYLGARPENVAPNLRIWCLSTNSSHVGNINFLRSHGMSGPIYSGYEIMNLSAVGQYATGDSEYVGEIKFYACENFSATTKGTAFSIKTHSAGSTGSFAIRHLIAENGLTRIKGGLIAGTIDRDPISTLESTGSFGAAIISTTGALTLNKTHFTVIISATSAVTLPTASTVTGRIYIIVNKSGGTRTINPGYVNLSGATVTTLSNSASIIVQSNGSVWHQIN